ncbi:MAG TPA: AMP-binding protein [Frankiaceae bacterium]|nr:AMP-binding protein [Frankiaceae bacterium]
MTAAAGKARWAAGAGGWAAHLPPGTDPAAVDLLARRSLPAAWAKRWAAEPDRPVLHDVAAGWVTAGGLERASTVVAGRLRRAGLRPGDRVLLCARTSTALATACCGALRAGGVVVPVNPACTEREMTYVVADAAPAVAVVDDAERAGWVRRADDRVITVVPRVDLPDAAPGALDEVAPDDPALLVYTSGTTGAPKGALLRHGNLLAGAEAVRLAWRWEPSDRLALPLPLFHVHGLVVGLFGTLLVGGSALLQPRFDPAAVLAAAQGSEVTLLFGVPTMYARLAAHERAGALARLRLCVCGSAPLPPELYARVERRCGQRLLDRYGMTETLMLASNPYDGQRRPGTVGLPLPGVQIRLAGGGGGEVEVRGPNVFAGYWRRPEASAQAFTADGWFRTGDLGEHDGAGYLRIVGRVKELVISGGFNVYPQEVEDVLRRHPGVADVAVAGTPDPEWGEVVTAYVVADGAPDLDALRAHAARELAPYKRPRIVHLVDALPRNALGKVQRHRLRPDRPT